MSERITQVVKIMPKAFRIERPGTGGDLALYVDKFRFMTLHYDYAYTSNAGQYIFLEKLAREWMREGDTLEIDGVDKTSAPLPSPPKGGEDE